MASRTIRPHVRVGKRFGRFAVVGILPGKNSHRMCSCECACGKVRPVRQEHLETGAIQSCGCHRAAVSTAKATVHGAHKGGKPTSEWLTWRNLRSRCHNPKDKSYPNYGGRGIAVCDRWRSTDGFVNFLADMGPRPSPKHTIERQDNDGPYAPWNCVWATREQQQANKRNSINVMLDGQLMTLSDAAKLRGLRYHTVKARRAAGMPEARWFVPVNNKGC